MKAFSAGPSAVLIPARDEESTIAGVVHGVAAHARPDLILVVDDGSTDETGARAEEAGAQVISTGCTDGALGAAMQSAIRTGLSLGIDVFMTIDADGQYDPRDLPRLRCRFTDQGPDLLVGDRMRAGRPVGMTRRRHALNRAFSSIFALALSRLHDLDAQSGMRVFSRDLAVATTGTNSFTYTQEQILRAHLAGFHVESSAVSFGPRRAGESRLVKNSVHYALRTVPHLMAIAARAGFESSGDRAVEPGGEPPAREGAQATCGHSLGLAAP